MKTATTILFTLIFLSGFSQINKQIDIPIDLQLCNSVYYDNQKIWTKLNLIDLQKDNDLLIIRITDCHRVIEINKKYGIKVFPIVYGKNGLISKELKIDLIDTELLIQKLLNLKIDTLPNDSKIIGYQIGQDGMSTGFEYSTPTKYRYFSYWCPDHQPDSLITAKLADSIIKTIDYTINWTKIFNDFRNDLRPGRYSYCMITMEKKRINIFKRLFGQRK